MLVRPVLLCCYGDCCSHCAGNCTCIFASVFLSTLVSVSMFHDNIYSRYVEWVCYFGDEIIHVGWYRRGCSGLFIHVCVCLQLWRLSTVWGEVMASCSFSSLPLHLERSQPQWTVHYSGIQPHYHCGECRHPDQACCFLCVCVSVCEFSCLCATWNYVNYLIYLLKSQWCNGGVCGCSCVLVWMFGYVCMCEFMLLYFKINDDQMS